MKYPTIFMFAACFGWAASAAVMGPQAPVSVPEGPAVSIPEAPVSDPQQASSSDPQQASSSDPQQASSSDPQQASSSDPQQASSSDPQQASSSDPQQASSSDPQQASSSDPQQASSSNANSEIQPALQSTDVIWNLLDDPLWWLLWNETFGSSEEIDEENIVDALIPETLTGKPTVEKKTEDLGDAVRESITSTYKDGNRRIYTYAAVTKPKTKGESPDNQQDKDQQKPQPEVSAEPQEPSKVAEAEAEEPEAPKVPAEVQASQAL